MVDDPRSPSPPAWALALASQELYDVADRAVVIERAWQLVRENQDRHEERHDEFDDPDQGGEA